MNNNVLKVKLVNPNAKPPVRAHKSDAGADLSASGYYFIPAGEMAVVDTGVSIALDRGYVGLVFSRSGMGKKRVSLANAVGVIDADYRGELKVMVENNGSEDFSINMHDRIAQLVILPVYTPSIELYTGTDEDWVDTTRGVGGFGSTGFRQLDESSTKAN